MRIRHLLAVLAFFVVLPCAASDSPKVEIEQVVARFQLALKTHDRASLSALFLADSKAWWTVLGDASFQKKCVIVQITWMRLVIRQQRPVKGSRLPLRL